MSASETTLVFLGAYQGRRFLDAQIESILNQTVPVDLWVSDDGSTDGTRERVLEYALSDSRVHLVDGPRRGFVANFASVFARDATSDYAYLAFADQDDVWDLDKLARAQASIGSEDAPVLYGSATRLINARGVVVGASATRPRPLAFANALVESFAGGNTLVLNRQAIQCVVSLRQRLGAHRDHWISHDWMLYLMMTLGGHRVVYDPEPSVGYRQHGANMIGGNRRVVARLRRAWGLFNGRFRAMVRHNAVPLQGLRAQMTPEARSCFDAYRALTESPVSLRAWYQVGLYRQHAMDQQALTLAVMLGRFP